MKNIKPEEFLWTSHWTTPNMTVLQVSVDFSLVEPTKPKLKSIQSTVKIQKRFK